MIFTLFALTGVMFLLQKELENSNVKIAAVIGFPLGAMTKEAKIFEAKECIANGASEIDMVINVGFVKSGMMAEVGRNKSNQKSYWN